MSYVVIKMYVQKQGYKEPIKNSFPDFVLVHECSNILVYCFRMLKLDIKCIHANKWKMCFRKKKYVES